MLFITNRALVQGWTSTKGRKVDFNLKRNEAQQSLYFCERTGTGKYTELMNDAFLARLRDSKADEILLYIHGFSNLPEPDIFPRTQALQGLLDKKQPKKVKVEVVPIIWPCDADFGVLKDYCDDQITADASGFAFARALAKLKKWQEEAEKKNLPPCLKRISVLAHSMGNRVLRETMRIWTGEILRDGPPLIFRNTFLVAADIVNESLERGRSGEPITSASRNVVVYFASDDLALRASKVINLKNRVASRRLGHTGPENMDKVPRNVHAVDCDNVNNKYDPPSGHSYFLYGAGKKKSPGEVFNHMYKCLTEGRVALKTRNEDRITVL